jgi:preprotein translocase subunit SecE
MKKQSQKSKKKKKATKRKTSASRKPKVQTKEAAKPVEEKPRVKAVPQVQKKPAETKTSGGKSPMSYIRKGGQFLKEARMELKKVKWPTRKELLASTAVVIVLTLLVAFFLGLVDFGLIKIIKNIVG